MYTVPKFFQVLSVRQFFIKPTLSSCQYLFRSFADTSKSDVTSKQVAIQGTENEEKLRVRRARPADVPRVLKFVRENAKYGWPGLIAPRGASQLLLCDYVSRSLAQGHSMIAEVQENRQKWTEIKGVAVAASVCPWDATMIEKWARNIRCTRSRKLMHFTAHCLRAPDLHNKYRIHNILQITLIVPLDTQKNKEIISLLAKNVLQRGRDVGFPLVRFDVTQDSVAKLLEELQMKKEWQLQYDVLPSSTNKAQGSSDRTSTNELEIENNEAKGKFIAVFSAFTAPQESKEK